MIRSYRQRIDAELNKFCREFASRYSSRSAALPLVRSLRDFVCRPGKRVRPLLFILGYTGYSQRLPARLFKSAAALEILHDFLLIHDDIVDRADLRRGRPAMHALLNGKRSGVRVKVTGEDLAIIAGDVLYAEAMGMMLSSGGKAAGRERALRIVAEATSRTAVGQFAELVNTMTDPAGMTKDEIYFIYDNKTAHYTCAAPLAAGAALAGASGAETKKLYRLGLFVGRAFQIRDDILGIYGDERTAGKTILNDLAEAKRTILVWYACSRGGEGARLILQEIFSKKTVGLKDLEKARELFLVSGALDFARREIEECLNRAELLLEECRMRTRSKDALRDYLQDLLSKP